MAYGVHTYISQFQLIQPFRWLFRRFMHSIVKSACDYLEITDQRVINSELTCPPVTMTCLVSIATVLQYPGSWQAHKTHCSLTPISFLLQVFITKGKVAEAPVWSVRGVLISLSVAVNNDVPVISFPTFLQWMSGRKLLFQQFSNVATWH